MHSVRILATAIAIFSSAITAEEIVRSMIDHSIVVIITVQMSHQSPFSSFSPFILFAFAITPQSGNLDLCIDSSSSNDGDKERLCLTPEGILKPSSSDVYDSQSFQFYYDNGLLRSVSEKSTGFCLGPTSSALSSKGCKSYELIPLKCPSTNNGDDEGNLVESRHMRFLITNEGRVQSLAGVQNPETGGDETSTNPFCLTMTKRKTDTHERAYLVPCHVKPSETANNHILDDFLSGEKKQIFDVYGTYSGSFLMPLRGIWSTKDPVELAFQVGLPSEGVGSPSSFDTDAKNSNFIEITTLWPVNGQAMETRIVDVIPLETSLTGGIITLEPFGPNLDGFGYQLDGKLTATLKTTEGEIDECLVLNKALFWVSKTMGDSPAKTPTSSYLIFIYIFGIFGSCLLLSVLIETIFAKKTRAEGVGNNDGKTVCMSTEEEEENDDFSLDNNIEEGFGVIRVCVGKNSIVMSSDTDIDESRNSNTAATLSEQEV